MPRRNAPGERMAKIVVDGSEIEVPDHYTILQACEEAGAEIPRFCFHERLSIAGNCRMCLVEVVGGPPKPAASCAMGVKDLRPGKNGEPPEVRTKSPMVKKAREGVMEFLLINHPLDCPICDQGGECDLQDQAMAYGVDSSRFRENKRAVEDKYIGPLVKTIMNRCIHCTRCVRFTTEVAGISELGLTGRGEDAEITTYLEQAMTSELQGNVIDLCPVGALTSRPNAFQIRPWELTKTESIDVMDAVGSNIRVDTRGREVMRIVPRENEDVNEEWISDKARFHWDGLRTQRLDRPFLRENGKLRPATWPEAFAAVKAAVDGAEASKIGAIAGDMTSVEEMFAMKALLNALGSESHDCRQDGAKLDPAPGRSSYLFNPSIAGIDEADAILLIGALPRREAAVLNARIRRRWREGGLSVGLIGEAGHDHRYDVTHIGAGPESLSTLGDHSFMETLRNAERPLVIVGTGAVARENGAEVLAAAGKLVADLGGLNDDWNGLAVLHTAASRVGGLDLGFVPGEGGMDAASMLADADVLFLMGADEIALDGRKQGQTLVYIGHHGDRGAHAADIILPAAAYTEKSGTFVNLEGRVQMTSRAIFAPGEAKEDWAILRALSDVLGHRLPFDSLAQLRAKLYEAHPHMMRIDEIERGEDELAGARALASGAKGKLDGAPFRPAIDDFYLTNPITRASKIMADCSALALADRGDREAAE